MYQRLYEGKYILHKPSLLTLIICKSQVSLQCILSSVKSQLHEGQFSVPIERPTRFNKLSGYSTLSNRPHGSNSRHGATDSEKLIKNMDQISEFY